MLNGFLYLPPGAFHYFLATSFFPPGTQLLTTCHMYPILLSFYSLFISLFSHELFITNLLLGHISLWVSCFYVLYEQKH